MVLAAVFLTVLCFSDDPKSFILLLLFNLLGKHMIGTLKNIAHAPNTRKPSHHAPIHLGSDGVMSTATENKTFKTVRVLILII